MIKIIKKYETTIFFASVEIKKIFQQLRHNCTFFFIKSQGEGITNSEMKQRTMTIESNIQELEIKNKKEYVKLNELKKMLRRVSFIQFKYT